MKKLILIISVLIGVQTSFAQVANDDCFGAIDLGTAATPNPCDGSGTEGQGASTVFNLTNTAAIAENPYTSLVGCQGGVDMSTPAADVWYSFTASGNQAVIGIAGLNTPNIGLYYGACGALTPFGCAVGAVGSGAVTGTFDQLIPGTVYYLQISGQDEFDTGNFTLDLVNNIGCTDCLVSSNLTVSPAPTNGTFLAGTAVTFCYTVTEWQQTNTNWFHGIEINFGAGWDVASLGGLVPAASCDGLGTFGWFNSITSSANGNTEGAGFYYDIGGDGDPGNNFGDNCQGAGLNWQFCWTINAGSCPPLANGADLGLVINTLGDGEVGSWSNLGCSTDPDYIFSSSLACCAPPTMAGVQEICLGDNNGSITATAIGTDNPWDYVWTDAGGATLQTDLNQNGTSTISNLAPGTYTVTVTDNNGCVSSADFTLVAGPSCVNCVIDSLPIALTNCYVDGGGFLVWDAAGTVYYTDPPTTGTLTVTACDGQTVVFNAPFAAGSSAFTFTGLPQGVGNCNFTGVFSADPLCTFTQPFLTPPVITFFQSFCTVGGGAVNGDITFDATYSSGTLTISVFDGTSTIDTNIILPAASPQNWSVSGLDPTANPYTISYFFSDYPTCGGQVTMNCGCSADAGTVTTNITGDGTNNYVLCDGDQIDITTNNDFVDPDDIGPLGTGPFYPFNPALMYVVYSCPPTPGIWPPLDPCYVGLLPVTNTMTDINNAASWANTLPGGPYTDLWYAQTNVYSWDGATAVWNSNCWDVGPAVQVTYLSPIATPAVPDCQNGTVTVTLTGGYPEQFGGNYTASNLLPATASFVNTTAAHGGDIVIDGLQNGDMWSFDVVDGNGCPITVSGGPFVGLPTANAGTDDTICALTYNLAAVASVGTGTWTGPAGITFGTANSATSTVTATTAGTYTLTWTEDNGGGCTAADQVDITFTQMSITFSAFDASCDGMCDGNAIVIPAGGIVGPGGYTYTWTPGSAAGNVPNATNLCVGTYSLNVSDQSGCSVDTLNWVISAPVSVTFSSVIATDETCAAACDGSIAVTSPTATTFSIDGGPFAAPATFNGLCAGTYTITGQDPSGCQVDTTATINAPPAVTLTATPDSTICIGGTATITATGGGGVGGFVYLWDTGETTATITPSPVGTQQYCVGVVDANGCPAPAQVCVTITVNPTLQVIALSDQGICPGDIASISALANGGDGNHTYTWDNGLGVGQLQNVSPAVTTTYTVTASDGCETPDATASVTITVNPLPTVDFTPDTVDGCSPVTVNFTEIGQPAGSQCFWDFGDANAAVSCGTVTNTYTAPGCYDVTLTVISDLGCTDQISYPSLICVYPYPSATFLFGPQPTSVLDPTINFTNTSTGADTYDWSFGIGGSLGTSTDTDPTFTFPSDNPDSYQACLVATTSFGCQDSTCSTVVIDEEFLVYVPNAFTPDADNINEVFTPVVIGADPLQYEFLIFNRWGELIYDSQVLGTGWDGTYKGLMVQQDVYVWRLKVVNAMNNEKHEYKGHVTILK